MASIGNNGASASPRGVSLHVGLNNVDTNHYGLITVLAGCINDAHDMAKLAAEQGFEESSILTEDQATRAAVTGKILEAAGKLQPGDIFFYTYSGHGSNLRDRDGDEHILTAGDKLDETWCLYDGMLIDDEAAELWLKFKPGVRLVLLMDCCHSGTAVRASLRAPRIPPGSWRRRALALEDAAEIFARNKAFYESIIKPAGAPATPDPVCALRLISGCQDNQVSLDGDTNGLFTQNLLAVWNGGAFAGDYPGLHQQVKDRIEMVADQSPNFFFTGTQIAGFDQQRPFTV